MTMRFPYPGFINTSGVFRQAGNTLYVRDYGSASGDGSIANPFSHPNQAISLIKSNADASASNLYLVDIGDGIYEGVFFNVPYTTLKGAGVGSTFFKGTATALALYWGNATQASVDAFVLADGHAEASIDTDYTSLVADGTVTTLLGGKVSNVTIESDDAANVALAKIYVGNGFDTALELRYLDDIYTPPTGGSIYFRNITGISAKLLDVADTVYIRNCRIAYMDFCKTNDLNALHDTGADLPAAPWNTTTVINGKDLHISNAMTIDGDGATCSVTMLTGSCNSAVTLANSGKITAENVHFDNNFTGDGSPNITLENCYIDGNFSITNPVTVTATLNGTHIQGNISLAAGGSKTVTMNGGSYMGSLTDPDVVLTRNAGS